MLTVLALMLLATAVGCSGDEATAPARLSPQDLLIGKEDLPPRAKLGAEPPEACGPVPILEAQGAKAAVSEMFTFKPVSVVEAVGVAPSPQKAAAALDSLQLRQRMLCIGNVIAEFGPQDGAFVNMAPSQPVAAGEEGARVQFREVDKRSRLVNTTDVVSFRSGRCVASFLFLVQGKDEQTTVIRSISDKAGDRLSSHPGCA